jgi:hypothetical protein
MGVHSAKLLGVLEAIRTTIWGILAVEIEVSASLAGSVSIALDLPPFTFVADRQVNNEFI